MIPPFSNNIFFDVIGEVNRYTKLQIQNLKTYVGIAAVICILGASTTMFGCVLLACCGTSLLLPLVALIIAGMVLFSLGMALIFITRSRSVDYEKRVTRVYLIQRDANALESSLDRLEESLKIFSDCHPDFKNDSSCCFITVIQRLRTSLKNISETVSSSLLENKWSAHQDLDKWTIEIQELQDEYSQISELLQLNIKAEDTTSLAQKIFQDPSIPNEDWLAVTGMFANLNREVRELSGVFLQKIPYSALDASLLESYKETIADLTLSLNELTVIKNGGWDHLQGHLIEARNNLLSLSQLLDTKIIFKEISLLLEEMCLLGDPSDTICDDLRILLNKIETELTVQGFVCFSFAGIRECIDFFDKYKNLEYQEREVLLNIKIHLSLQEDLNLLLSVSDNEQLDKTLTSWRNVMETDLEKTQSRLKGLAPEFHLFIADVIKLNRDDSEEAGEIRERALVAASRILNEEFVDGEENESDFLFRAMKVYEKQLTLIHDRVVFNKKKLDSFNTMVQTIEANRNPEYETAPDKNKYLQIFLTFIRKEVDRNRATRENILLYKQQYRNIDFKILEGLKLFKIFLGNLEKLKPFLERKSILYQEKTQEEQFQAALKSLEDEFFQENRYFDLKNFFLRTPCDQAESILAFIQRIKQLTGQVSESATKLLSAFQYYLMILNFRNSFEMWQKIAKEEIEILDCLINRDLLLKEAFRSEKDLLSHLETIGSCRSLKDQLEDVLEKIQETSEQCLEKIYYLEDFETTIDFDENFFLDQDEFV